MKHIIEKLKTEETVTFSPRGNSMTPKIKSGQKVTIKRLTKDEKLKLSKNDIVFCKVKNNIYLHLISAIKGDQVQISNNHGYVNGWTHLDNIYAILINK